MATDAVNSALKYFESPYLNKNSAKRTVNIDSITLHCLYGYSTYEKLFSYYNTIEQSCHYIIDVKGIVGLITDEERASIYTKNEQQDNRSISITVAVDTDKYITNATYNKLTDLVTDICERYKDTIGKLNWSDDTQKRKKHEKLENSENVYNISLYSDFTNDNTNIALFNKAELLVKSVNAKLDHRFTDTDQSEDYDTTMPITVSSNVNIASTVSKDDVITCNRALSRDEMEINARYIWQYLGSRGWTLNAVAGMLGNIESESTMSPTRCEVGDGVDGTPMNPTTDDIENYAYRYYAARSEGNKRFPGYGLVQWTGQLNDQVPKDDWKYQKFIYWCNERNLDPTDIDSQLQRLFEDSQNNKHFYDTGTPYDITFKEFSESTQAPYYLGGVFLACFERPANPDPETRGKQAEAWYDFLLPYSIVSSPVTYGLHLTNLGADYFEASCYLQNTLTDTVVQLSVFNDKDELIDTVDCEVPALKKEAIFYKENLKPNTQYKIILTTTSSKSLLKEPDEEDVEETEDASKIDTKTAISFKTLPGAPGSITDIKLTPMDLTLPSRPFTISITPPDSWGYWPVKNKNTKHGYEIQYIINSKIVKTELINASAFKSEFTLLPADLLKAAVKPGDILQIGVRTWVINSSNRTIYDNTYAKVSNAICLITQKYLLFITK